MKKNPKDLSRVFVVVATKTPERYKEQALAYYPDDSGGHITNASFDQHMSPNDGTVVTASGRKAQVDINEQGLTAVKCPNTEQCGIFNVTAKVQLAERENFHCIACATQLNYDPAPFKAFAAAQKDEDGDDGKVEATKTEMKGGRTSKKKKAKQFTKKKTGGKTKADDDGGDDLEAKCAAIQEQLDDDSISDKKRGKLEEKLATLKEQMGSDEGDDNDDDVEDADIEMADTVDDDDTLEIVAVAENVIAAVTVPRDDMPIRLLATLDDKSDRFTLAQTDGFVEGLNKAVLTAGAATALKDAGFSLVSIAAPAVIANARVRAEAQGRIAAATASDDYRGRFLRCVDIVSAGSLKGMFAKSGAPDLFGALTASFKKLNVANPTQEARRVLASSLPSYNKAMLETAAELTDRDDSALTAIAAQIGDTDASKFSFADVKPEGDGEPNEIEASVTERLKKPLKAAAETAGTKDDEAPKGRFTGIFAS